VGWLVILATIVGFAPPIIWLRRARKITPVRHINNIEPQSAPDNGSSTPRAEVKSDSETVSTEAAEGHPKMPTAKVKPEILHSSHPMSGMVSDGVKRFNRQTTWIFPACVVVVVVVVLLFMFSKYENDSSSLELELSDTVLLTIRNVGTHPIRLLDVTINERDECKPAVGLFGLGHLEPRELKVGDFILLLSPCSIVRATARTDGGSWTYSFTRR
jgi:hypothetical protein